MKIILSSLAIIGMLLVGGYVVAPAFATSPPVCTVFNHPVGCVQPTPIFANAGGDGAVNCKRHGDCPPSSAQ